MRRRQILAGLFSTALVTGCTGNGSDQTPPVGLERISLSNSTNDPLPLQITVEKDGDRVHHERISLDGHQEIVEEWMGDRVHYSVTVTIPEDPRESEVTTAQIESMVSEWNDIKCFELRFAINREEIAPYIHNSESCN